MRSVDSSESRCAPPGDCPGRRSRARIMKRVSFHVPSQVRKQFHQTQRGCTRSSSSQGGRLIYSERLFTGRPACATWQRCEFINGKWALTVNPGAQRGVGQLARCSAAPHCSEEQEQSMQTERAVNQRRPPGSFIKEICSLVKTWFKAIIRVQIPEGRALRLQLQRSRGAAPSLRCLLKMEMNK